MHACESERSTQTLCGQALDVPTVGRVWGFTAVCAACYPADTPFKEAEAEDALPISKRG